MRRKPAKPPTLREQYETLLGCLGGDGFPDDRFELGAKALANHADMPDLWQDGVVREDVYQTARACWMFEIVAATTN